MEVYNIVGQYNLEYSINICLLLRYLCWYYNTPQDTPNTPQDTPNTPNTPQDTPNTTTPKVVIKSIKFRKFIVGNCTNTKTFKNALHVELESPKCSCKIFPKGSLHLSGIKSFEELKIVKEYFLNTLHQQKVPVDIMSSEHQDTNLLKCVSEKLGEIYAFTEGETKGCLKAGVFKIPYENTEEYLYSDYTQIIPVKKRGKIFMFGSNLKKMYIIGTNGEFLNIKLELLNRKNIPCKKKFHIVGKKLYYNFNNKLLGEFIYPSKEKYTSVYESLPPKDYYCEMSTTNPDTPRQTFDIHNINTGCTIDKRIHVQDIGKILKKKDIPFKVSKQKAETLTVELYYNVQLGEFFLTKDPDYKTVKIQFYNSKDDKIKIRYTLKYMGMKNIKEFLLKSVLNDTQDTQDTQDTLNTQKDTQDTLNTQKDTKDTLNTQKDTTNLSKTSLLCLYEYV